MQKKAVPLDEMLKDLAPERRKKIRRRAVELATEYEANQASRTGSKMEKERTEIGEE